MFYFFIAEPAHLIPKSSFTTGQKQEMRHSWDGGGILEGGSCGPDVKALAGNSQRISIPGRALWTVCGLILET